MRSPVLAVLPFLAACYTYAPIQLAAVRPGSGIRVRITAAFGEELGPLLGTREARVLSGLLIDSRPDTLIVEVPTVVRAEIGSAIQTLNQRVSIPRSAVIEVEGRRLDRFKTYTVAGVASVALGVFVIRALTKDPGLEGAPGGGGGDLRIP